MAPASVRPAVSSVHEQRQVVQQVATLLHSAPTNCHINNWHAHRGGASSVRASCAHFCKSVPLLRRLSSASFGICVWNSFRCSYVPMFRCSTFKSHTFECCKCARRRTMLLLIEEEHCCRQHLLNKNKLTNSKHSFSYYSIPSAAC